MVMQVGLHGLEKACPQSGFQVGQGMEKHFLKCFADDLTIIDSNVKRLQNSISKLEEITE